MVVSCKKVIHNSEDGKLRKLLNLTKFVLEIFIMIFVNQKHGVYFLVSC